MYDLAAVAGQTLGDEHWVWHSAVRRWSAEYIEGAGVVQPDGRGHYTRELLVLEEASATLPSPHMLTPPLLNPFLPHPPSSLQDIYRKFMKWSLSKAKKDELSVEEARDYLNKDLLASLPQSTLTEYQIKLPISSNTVWRWMQVGYTR